MALRVDDNGQWALVPEEADRAFISTASAWLSAKEIYVSVEGPGIGEFSWEPGWVGDPDIPDGVVVSLQQTQISGGDVQATWTNNNSVYSIEVQWRINSTVWGSNFHSPGTGQSILDESEVQGFDVVEARMRYFTGGNAGEWGAWSDPLAYQE